MAKIEFFWSAILTILNFEITVVRTVVESRKV